MKKPCQCGNAREWLLGYAAAQCAAGKAGVKMFPLFDDSPSVTDTPTLTRRDCPPQCDPAECDSIYNDFKLLYDACLSPECRAQVQAAYDGAVASCTPVG